MKNIHSPNDLSYSTTDLGLAVTISLWYPLDSIDKSNPQKAFFIFKRDENLESLLDMYWRRELKVEPQSYFSQLKFIKSRLYGEQ